mmetsp:Transcript_14385/g.56591  ORF Transcript_14385/g.56591 Transcript_14385/m.56591 type:complete len:274 (+) Transcript_14385:444-1265(+)
MLRLHVCDLHRARVALLHATLEPQLRERRVPGEENALVRADHLPAREDELDVCLVLRLQQSKEVCVEPSCRHSTAGHWLFEDGIELVALDLEPLCWDAEDLDEEVGRQELDLVAERDLVVLLGDELLTKVLHVLLSALMRHLEHGENVLVGHILLDLLRTQLLALLQLEPVGRPAQLHSHARVERQGARVDVDQQLAEDRVANVVEYHLEWQGAVLVHALGGHELAVAVEECLVSLPDHIQEAGAAHAEDRKVRGKAVALDHERDLRQLRVVE